MTSVKRLPCAKPINIPNKGRVNNANIKITTIFFVMNLIINRFMKSIKIERKKSIYRMGGKPNGSNRRPPPPNITSKEIKKMSILFNLFINTYKENLI